MLQINNLEGIVIQDTCRTVGETAYRSANKTDRVPSQKTFFDIIIHKPDDLRGLSGICIGFEFGKWRCERFSKYLFNYLPEFALTRSEYENMDYTNAMDKLRNAARTIYTTKKFENRGEFGELILHVVMRDLFNTIPAISKIYYKSNTNETVKGFDAVHVISTGDGLELWLGEVKFYASINKAISDVVNELEKHSKSDYLRDEFILISRKIEDSWEHSRKLKRLLNPDTSLDDVFSSICIPVLLTYNSKTANAYEKIKSDYRSKIEEEIGNYYKKFVDKDLPKNLKIHLFLLPLKSKKEVLGHLQTRLTACQDI